LRCWLQIHGQPGPANRRGAPGTLSCRRHQSRGINAEVAKGQWEFQIFAKGSAKAADDVWTARYLMMRLCESTKSMLNCTASPSRATGMGPACTATSPPSTSAKWGKEYFEEFDDRLLSQRLRAHRRIRPRQPPALDRSATKPRPLTSSAMASPIVAHPSACPSTSSRTGTRLPGRPPPQLRRRSLPDRLPYSQDDQQRPQTCWSLC